MKRFIKHSIIFGFITFVILEIIGFSSLFSLRQSSFYKPNFIMNQVAETNFDYIILGSSTGLTTLNSIQIDSITNYNGINLSMDDTSMGTHFLMLQHFIALGKNTKRCVLTISDYNMDETDAEMSGNDYRFLSLIDRDYVYDYFKSYEKGFVRPLTYSKYVPFLGVGYYNAELFYPSLLTAPKPNKRNRFDDKGNYMFPDGGIPKEIDFKDIIFKVNNPFYEKIKSICATNNIKLIVYHPPFYKQKSITNDALDNFINHSDLLPDKGFFYDNVHVNSKGRETATKAFAETLKSY